MKRHLSGVLSDADHRVPDCSASLIPLRDVVRKEVEWLWVDRVPLGKITVLAGDAGQGKSYLTLDWAARVSRGRRWPDGTDGILGSAIIASAEDDAGDTIRPRLEAMHAELNRIHFVNEEAGSFTLAHIDALRRLLRTVPDCKLLIIDPLGAYVGGVDSHRDSDVRQLLRPLARLAAEFKVAVVLVAHLNKATGSRAADRVMGSRAFTAAARNVWLVGSHPSLPSDHRAMVSLKSNLAPHADGLSFSVNGKGRVCWDDEPVELTADELLAGGSKTGPRPDRRIEAEKFLREVLRGGAVLRSEIERKAAEAGISFSGAIHRAAKCIGIVKEGGGGKPYTWRLPAPEQPAQPAQAVREEVEQVRQVRRVRSFKYRRRTPEQVAARYAMYERRAGRH